MGDVRNAAADLLGRVAAVRAAFPDAAAMRAVDIGVRPAEAVLRPLWHEAALVRAGGATDLTVLDDELAAVEKWLGGQVG